MSKIGKLQPDRMGLKDLVEKRDAYSAIVESDLKINEIIDVINFQKKQIDMLKKLVHKK